MHHIGFYIAGGLAVLGAGAYLYAKFGGYAKSEVDAAAKSVGGKLTKL